MWQAAAGAVGGELLGAASSIGGGYFNSYMTRELRRTAYQDQMHSMRQAGLNPILAAGATPSNATAPPVNLKPDFAGSAEKVGDAMKVGDQRELLRAQTTAAEAGARQAEAQADSAEFLRDAQREELLSRAGLSGEKAETESANRPNLLARTRAEYEATFNRGQLDAQRRDWGFVQADIDRIRAQSARDRASAGLSNAQEAGQLNRNVRTQLEADYIRDYQGLIKSGMAADDVLRILGPATETVSAILGIRGGRRAAERSRTDSRRADQGDREQDRRDRDELRREYQADY